MFFLALILSPAVLLGYFILREAGACMDAKRDGDSHLLAVHRRRAIALTVLLLIFLWVLVRATMILMRDLSNM